MNIADIAGVKSSFSLKLLSNSIVWKSDLV